MLHALSALVLAAEAEPETSKTAFYVFGGLLAVWAVVLSALGMSQATFPATTTAKRGVIGLTALFMIGAMATAVITA
ncbi:MAG TPA: hypothetical protein VK501_17820 [Baekduia sp.]|uniref:hypothetical protein n=1 Tax=Baekduia sp. TaxID=2600305 RepID=UPI002BB61209|nr:hypothetical protein [Baekduia sp.]HMJ35767.1 hypothetical protein [Baekduia sp.]